MYACGCRAFCVESRTHPDFLNEGWWSDMEMILTKAESLGMKVWILDDAHFPTGYANGRMPGEDISLAPQFLYRKKADVCGPMPGGRLNVAEMVKYYDRNRHLIVNGLNRINGFSCLCPKGAFYIFPSIAEFGMSSEEFCTRH